MSYMTNGSIEWDVPKPFDGTDEERQTNRNTHFWVSDSPISLVCAKCDAKDWHVASNYPCGTEPPRMVVTQQL